ncbi:MAG: hypothetical protein UX61_C0004G0010 [Parcubacteria group bacterium GW2011_GWA2_46_7]|nr:MAG: hypothetical protein UX61_C0004G0010 [Parcubacteria group bacterium GW2011_GWA2_46_7]
MATKSFDIRPRAKTPKRVEDFSIDSSVLPRKRKRKTEENSDVPSETSVRPVIGSKNTTRRDAFLEYVSQSPRADEPFSVPIKQYSKFSMMLRKTLRAIVFIGLCAGGVYGAGMLLARVNVRMTISQAVQEDIFSLRLSRMASGVASTSGLFFEDTKKEFFYTQSYPATGKGNALGYAKGTLLVQNSYSAQSMRFVAGTRFRDDKGSIFRTQQAILIPGYTKQQDKIIPGTVSVEVKADAAGGSGNLLSGTMLRVVAFEGSEKYETISGVVKQDFQGGAQGETTIVSAEDIQNGKQQIVEYAFSKAKEEVLQSLPEGTRVLDRALQLKITKITTKFAPGDAVSSFEVSVEGELRIRFFDERQIRQYIEANMEQPVVKNDVVESELQISYENVSSSFETSEMTMQVRARRVVRPVLDTLAFRQRIAGKAINDLRAELLKFEGLEKVDISVWPFWLSRSPTNIDNIRIILE